MAVSVNLDDQLTVGFVRGAHGLTGEFKVESASGFYEHIAVLKEVTLRNEDRQKVFRRMIIWRFLTASTSMTRLDM